MSRTNQRRRLKKGIHDIEKEIEFESNSKIIAHDSEGFEAANRAEVDVVCKFIDGRSQVEDINQKLHLVWFVLLLFLAVDKLSQIVVGTACR